MKTFIVSCFLLMGICIMPQLSAQTLEEAGWPKQHEALSLYVGSNGFAKTVNLTFDHHFRGQKGHFGYSAGVNYLFLDSWSSSSSGDRYLGPHFTINLMSGKKGAHFEAKVGGALGLIELGQKKDYQPFVPLLSLGFRYQLPGKIGIFRIGITTLMPGIGGGAVIGQQW